MIVSSLKNTVVRDQTRLPRTRKVTNRSTIQVSFIQLEHCKVRQLFRGSDRTNALANIASHVHLRSCFSFQPK